MSDQLTAASAVATDPAARRPPQRLRGRAANSKSWVAAETDRPPPYRK